MPAPEEPGVYQVRASTIDSDGFEGDFSPPQTFEIKRKWPYAAGAALGIVGGVFRSRNSRQKAPISMVRPAPSTCPDPAISSTGNGFHAYSTARHRGIPSRPSTTISRAHSSMSMSSRKALRPMIPPPSVAPPAKPTWAAGGYRVT